MIQAFFKEDPGFSGSGVDIVACGSTMGNLLRFVRNVDASFRMVLQVVGSTVFLGRKKRSPTELMQGVYGYGHTFPEAYTSWP